MESPPGREAEAARSPERRTWYGYGRLARVEKRGTSRYLHDLTYAFADVSVFSLPGVLLVFLAAGTAAFGVRTATLVAWLSMTATVAAIRGGWVTPLATTVPGWVSITPALVALRIAYYNAALAVTVAGSLALAGAVGSPPAAIAFAAVLAALATLAFPALAEAAYRRLAD
ncbi:MULTISPECIES: hypothetical protein [Saliphagus]|uniref:DUF8215 domain-containing protein n=1 Tax=Saliphagus infecundisoli TaxID=1849069 RepID=A0ABD5QBT3_9EURY|nr:MULTISPECIES: hypothetical protein [Saliphagus]